MLAFAICAVVFTTALASDQGAKAAYVGGTLAGVPAGASGRMHTTDPDALRFQAAKSALRIPYESVNYLEYGQQAGRRHLLAVAVSPLFLLSKSRKHFLTVSYRDQDGHQQAAVFRVDKKDVRSVLAGLEARTGLKVDFQDDEARKSGGG